MRFLIQMTIGLIREQSHRRMAMFVAILAAILLLFAGSTFLAAPLIQRPVLFFVFWFVCAWLTFLSLLLAAYDLLLVRKAAREERARLRREHLLHPE